MEIERMKVRKILLILIHLINFSTCQDFNQLAITSSNYKETFSQAKANETCEMFGIKINTTSLDMDKQQFNFTNVNYTSKDELFWTAAGVKFSPWINYAGCYETILVNITAEQPLDLKPYIGEMAWKPWKVACLQHCGFSDFVVRNFSCYCTFKNFTYLYQHKTLITCEKNKESSILNELEKNNCSCIFQILNNLELNDNGKIGKCLTVKYTNNNSSPEFNVVNCSESYHQIFQRPHDKTYTPTTKPMNYLSALKKTEKKSIIFFNLNDIKEVFPYIGEGKFEIKLNTSYWIAISRETFVDFYNNSSDFCIAVSLTLTENNTGFLRPLKQQNCDLELQTLCTIANIDAMSKEATLLPVLTSTTNPVTSKENENKMNETTRGNNSASGKVDNSLMHIIVIIVSVAVFILVLAVTVCIALKKKKKKKRVKNITENSHKSNPSEHKPLNQNPTDNTEQIYNEADETVNQDEEVYNILHESGHSGPSVDVYDHVSASQIGTSNNASGFQHEQNDYAELPKAGSIMKPDNPLSDYDSMRNILQQGGNDARHIGTVNADDSQNELNDYAELPKAGSLLKKDNPLSDYDSMINIQKQKSDEQGTDLSNDND